MSPTLFEPKNSSDALFDGKRRLANIVVVQYRINHLKHEADARQLRLSPGDQVVVDAKDGPVIAEVTGPVQRRVVDVGSLPAVLREATARDLEQVDHNENIEETAYHFALKCIRARDMAMKLIRTQRMQDGSRLVFFFSAEGRVDFRDLVRDLAAEFRTRIEMRQIGVRDGARMIGGIGPCGRELCCSTFLTNFEPISVRMAKEQGLTLNPGKISGMCGRLMCCLVYEQKVYRRMRSRLPRSGQRVLTESGQGKVLHVDVINRRVTVALTGEEKRVTLPIEEVQLVDGAQNRRTVDTDSSGSEKKLWGGKPPRKKAQSDSDED